MPSLALDPGLLYCPAVAIPPLIPAPPTPATPATPGPALAAPPLPAAAPGGTQGRALWGYQGPMNYSAFRWATGGGCCSALTPGVPRPLGPCCTHPRPASPPAPPRPATRCPACLSAPAEAQQSGLRPCPKPSKLSPSRMRMCANTPTPRPQPNPPSLRTSTPPPSTNPTQPPCTEPWPAAWATPTPTARALNPRPQTLPPFPTLAQRPGLRL